MFGRLMGRKKSGGVASDDMPDSGAKDTDEAIIHDRVPDVVFAARPDRAPPPDPSWLDSVSLPSENTSGAAVASAVSVPAPAPGRKTAPVAPAMNPTPAEPLSAPALPPNSATSDRPQFPYGWLVIVEGPGTGHWFPLQRGLSSVGTGGDQTVHLGFGDSEIATGTHATLAYDDARHAFVLAGHTGHRLRLNGVLIEAPSTLRDGDVVTLGGTSLRLVALCSQNFHWTPDIEGR